MSIADYLAHLKKNTKTSKTVCSNCWVGDKIQKRINTVGQTMKKTQRPQLPIQNYGTARDVNKARGFKAKATKPRPQPQTQGKGQ